MTRAFPVSLLLHLLTLSMILWFGSHVARQVIPRQRTISVHLARLPQPRPQERPTVAEPPPEREQEREPPPPEEARTVEPQTRPTVVPEAAAPRETDEAKPEPTRNEPTTARADDVAAAEATSSAVGTDVVVPPRFQYYLDLLEARIARNWHPKQLGFRETASRVCLVHFHVEQNGLITRETLVQSSGVPLMDRESLQAVRAVGHFMPLPRGLADNALGVTYTFTLTSGN